jgi:hypothetical protein
MKKRSTIAFFAVLFLVLNSTVALALPTISSYDDQAFSKYATSEQLVEITITDDAETPLITAENDIRITMPDDFLAIYDAERTLTDLYTYGTAVDNGKVAETPAISFEDADKTLVIPVDVDFEAGESFVIRDIALEGFYNITTAGQYFQLTYDPAADPVQDAKYISIVTSSNTDSNNPDTPANIEITQLTDTSLQITWTDPTDQDLVTIDVLRSVGAEAAISGLTYQEIEPGTELYTEEGLEVGTVLNYQLRANDGRNISDPSDTYTYTIVDMEEEPEAEPEVEPVVEGTDEDPEPVLINEEGFCTLEYVPVCSANGVTYPNSCVAEKAGATVETEGACETPYCEVTEEPVCGVDGITYPNGCSLEKNDVMKAYDGECDIEYCPVEYEPVCAADGETYTNECVAGKQETEVLHDGECTGSEVIVPTFTDTSDHWAKDKVEAMAEKEIVEGNEDGSFNPNGTINRAESAAMLYRLLGLGEPAMPEAKPFDDVEKDLWFSGYISELKTLELASGKTETTYVPGEEMNRAEFLQMAMNVYYYMTETELAATAITSDFTDLPEDAWYSLTITEAYKMDFVSGKTETTYGPEDPISRAEAASILYNMFYELI